MQTIKAELERALVMQHEMTARWHDEGLDIEKAFAQAEQAAQMSPAGPVGHEGPQDLVACVVAQHACNFQLWHTEDTARRVDVDDAVIARCKRAIDALNQRRNDGMERVDASLMRHIVPLVPAGAASRYNTESLGMAVDRLSILSLKIWHMDEQLRRTDVDAAHIRSCADKAAVLCTQREDLQASVMGLLDEFAAGTKQPRLYFQFKMYNDPALNPELYARKRSA